MIQLKLSVLVESNAMVAVKNIEFDSILPLPQHTTETTEFCHHCCSVWCGPYTRYILVIIKNIIRWAMCLSSQNMYYQDFQVEKLDSTSIVKYTES